MEPDSNAEKNDSKGKGPARDDSEINSKVIPNPNNVFGRQMRKFFLFDESYINMNHGSFGTYPRDVRRALRQYQDRAEARPDTVIRYDYPEMLDHSREALASLLNVAVETIVLVGNATTGVNTVLRNLIYQAGDVIVYFDAIYPACEKTIQYLVETTAIEAVKVEGWSFPIEDDDLVARFYNVVKEVQQHGNRRVRVAVYDTICSMPGVRMPYEKLTKACRELGVLSLIDGAHGVGHIKLDLGELDSDFFVSNCHKWLFVPRGCAVMHVPLRNQHLIRSSLPTSHGFVPNSRKEADLESRLSQYITNPLPQSEKGAFVTNFEFVGTNDNGPFTCVPAALEFRRSIGGEDAIMAYCTQLAQEGGRLVANKLGTEVMTNASRTHVDCCFTTVKLPINLKEIERNAEATDERDEEILEDLRMDRAQEQQQYGQQAEQEQKQPLKRRKQSPKKRNYGDLVRDRITKFLVKNYVTFMAILFYREAWWVRLSAQIYLDLEDFIWSAEALKEVCEYIKMSL